MQVKRPSSKEKVSMERANKLSVTTSYFHKNCEYSKRKSNMLEERQKALPENKIKPIPLSKFKKP